MQRAVDDHAASRGFAGERNHLNGRSGLYTRQRPDRFEQLLLHHQPALGWHIGTLVIDYDSCDVLRIETGIGAGQIS
jgi:hypothetical protein